MIVVGKLNRQQLLALDFFADLLLTKQLKKHIILYVKFRKTMDCLGLVCIENTNSSSKPREFTMEINRQQSAKEILHTMAHEMVHVRQYAYGNLNEEATYWCGKTYARNLKYSEQPWEIEANSIGDILFFNYMEGSSRCYKSMKLMKT
jgi:hypothetical protein